MIDTLLSDVQKTVGSEKTRDEKLSDICALLKKTVPHYDWVGFYIADPARRILTLGPFVGGPTDHTIIPYGLGICGQSAESEETFLIQDVSAQENYLACSLKVQSEVVVPIMKNGKYLAQLDIDSHQKSPFTKEEKTHLEAICDLIADIF